MEVFIAFDGNLEAVPFLEASLEAWSKVKFAKPAVIQVKPGALFEIQRRVIADGLAKDDWYILADVDARPEETYVISQIHKHIAARKNLGMALIHPLFEVGERVRVMRKGLVTKWPPQTTDTYDQEHGEEIVKAGMTVETWDDVWYRMVPSAIEVVN